MKKSYLLIFCLIITLISITTISATNETNYTDINKNINTTHIQNQNLITNNNSNINKEIKSTTNDNNQKKCVKQTYNELNQTNINALENNTDIHLTNGTYYLNSMNINKTIKITGENKENTIIIANTTESIFNVSVNGQLILNNITLRDYTSNTTASINNEGILIINNSILTNNTGLLRTSKGGSIYNTGILFVLNSEFRKNYASWGASIYNNKGNTTIINSKFSRDSIQNVGGSVYSIHGNLKIYNSTFTQNQAVSGGAIYNAFGNLTVDNSMFLKNSATSFYGGAIYSTGISNITNSQFLYNNATYNGGAITNTNNFTLINCSLESNLAGESGGAIENIAWTKTENGNLTIIGCNFTENSALVNGGAIVNLNSTPVDGNYGTITSDNCIFQLNSAGESGGAIYNEQYINLQYNVFTDNDAQTSKTIYSKEDTIKSVENNWWGSNNPKWNKIGVTPDNWIIMSFTNITALVSNLNTKLEVTLNTLNNKEKINKSIPSREVIYLANNSTFKYNFQTIIGSVENVCVPSFENISARVDNEKITLNTIESNISYLIVNNIMQININLPDNVNGKISVKINNKTILNKINLNNGKIILNYTIPVTWNKEKYILSIVGSMTKGEILSKDIIINIPKRNVSTKVSIISNNQKIRTGDTIGIVASISCFDKKVNSGRVAFKINGKTIQTNVSVINGSAIINYTIPETFNPKNYNISIIYSGDGNKNSQINSTQLIISKENVYINPNSTMYLMSDTSISVVMELLDSHGNYIIKGLVCYKINGKTIKTNITLEDGTFSFDYTTPIVNDGKTLNQTLTVKMGENEKYEGMNINIPIIIQ